MQDYTIEIRYGSKQLGGFFSEIVPGFGATTQSAINLVRARVPDATINSITFHHAPAPPPPQISGEPRRWW